MTPLPPPALRSRLLDRVAASARASRAFFTVRAADGAPCALADGVVARTLYASDTPARRGEPARVRLLALAPHACWRVAAGPGRREWLVMEGGARVGDMALGTLGYRRSGSAGALDVVAGGAGARLYLREAPPDGDATDQVADDTPAAWHDFAPGIRRRLLWTRGGEAAMLYRTEAGAAVPGHGHGHDEECLMVGGELFLDDVLLRGGDWQLAPAGTAHASVCAETAALVFAHGDLDLDITS
jgi:hypothetical protein